MTEADHTADPTTFRGSWTVGADGSFNDTLKEKFASQLAQAKSLADAARNVGITYRIALQWAKHDDMKARKRVLRSMPEHSQTFSVSIAMIVKELHTNAQKAREAEQYKASNDALLAMYNIAKNEKSLLETFEAKGEEAAQGDIVERLKKRLGTLPSPIQAAVNLDAIDATPQGAPGDT